MKRWMTAFAAILLGSMLTIADADAKRLGGGRSIGMQRAPITQQAARPATAPQAPTAVPGQAARPQAAPAQSGWRKWAGPLAGLAAGIGLASLLSHFGMGGDFAGIIMMVLLAVIAFAVIRRLMNRGQVPGPQPAYAGAQTTTPPYQAAPVADSLSGAGALGSAGSTASGIPAGFDIDGFLRGAKVNFIRLQAAHDAGNLDDIREFTTPEMFAELKLDIDARAGRPEKTDVISLEAELLDVTDEAKRHLASVRFRGSLREEPGAAPTPLDEVWHLSKPADGSRGWTLAGIEQIQ